MNTTLQIRIDKKTKDKAQKTFKALGLDMSSAIKVFLNQVATDQCFPFVPSTKRTRRLRKMYDKEIAEALKSGKRYSSAKEMMDDILNEK